MIEEFDFLVLEDLDRELINYLGRFAFKAPVTVDQNRPAMEEFVPSPLIGLPSDTSKRIPLAGGRMAYVTYYASDIDHWMVAFQEPCHCRERFHTIATFEWTGSMQRLRLPRHFKKS